MRNFWVLVVVVLTAPMCALAWSPEQTRMGQEGHPVLLAQHGGEVSNKAIAGYVDGIGQVIVRTTPFANKPWTFTVLDTPAVNAFAVPGGYVYVTRGLLGLANSEAEVAAVIGHEVAHLTRNHVEVRQRKSQDAGLGVLAGTVLGAILDGKDGLRKGIELSSRLASGYVAQHSQKHEFEADEVGIVYLARAGYDAHAAGRFLATLAAKHGVEAKAAGKSYNPNRVDIFASHPPTGDRVRRAALTANRQPGGGDVVAEDFLMMIDGLIYGDSARQGFVRGRQFLHPQMRFAYEVPRDFVITNSARRVTAKGPGGAQMILQSGGRADGDPVAFLERRWLASLRKNNQITSVGKIKHHSFNGLPGARVALAMLRDGRPFVGEFAVIQHNGRFHLLSGITPGQRASDLRALNAAISGFRPISRAEADAARPQRLRVHTVKRGETIDSLSLSFPGAFGRERFLALNGMKEPAQLVQGQRVKLISY